MGVNSLPKRRGCDLNPGHSAPKSSTLTTRLPSHPPIDIFQFLDEKLDSVQLPLMIFVHSELQNCVWWQTIHDP